MTVHPSTLFVVYEPVSENGGMIAPYLTEEHALEFYEELVSDSLADMNIGLFVARLDNLTAEQVSALFSRDEADFKPILESEFEGFTITQIKAFEASYDSWAPAALNVGNADFDASGEEYRITP